MWPPACQSSAGTLLAGAGPRLLWRELVPGVSLPLWLEGSSRETGVRAWTRPAWRRLCGTSVQLRMQAVVLSWSETQRESDPYSAPEGVQGGAEAGGTWDRRLLWQCNGSYWHSGWPLPPAAGQVTCSTHRFMVGVR